MVVAFGCWMRFGRQFVFAKDIRRPRNADLFDAFPPMLAIGLLGFTLMVMNPTRFVRAVGKSVLWPVTLYRWFERKNGDPGSAGKGPTSSITDVEAPGGGPSGPTPVAAPSEGPAVPTPGPVVGPGAFAAKTMGGPLSLPPATLPPPAAGPGWGRHGPGPFPHGQAPTYAAPSWGGPTGPRPSPPAPGYVMPRRGAAPPPMSPADPIGRVHGGPAAPSAPHQSPRHRASELP